MKPREKKLLVAQLMATRSAFLAGVDQIEVALLTMGVDVERLNDEPVDCPHPPDQIVNHAGTLDDTPDDFQCQACGARQSEPFHPE